MRERLTWRESWNRLRADWRRLQQVFSDAEGAPGAWLLLHPSFICVFLHRISHHLFRSGHKYLARLVWHFNALVTGSDISPPADFGGGLVILNPAGISIMAKAGRNLTLMPLAGLGGELGRREDVGSGPGLPVLGDDVILEPHSGVLGPVRIGSRVRIAAVTCVTKDVPDDTFVQGPQPKLLRRRDSA
jgi:serine O-acetyltransferase